MFIFWQFEFERFLHKWHCLFYLVWNNWHIADAIANLDLASSEIVLFDAESLIIRFHFSLSRHAFAYTMHPWTETLELRIEQVTGNLHIATLINRLTFYSVKFEFSNFYFTFLIAGTFIFLSLLEKHWIENRWMDVWKKTCLAFHSLKLEFSSIFVHLKFLSSSLFILFFWKEKQKVIQENKSIVKWIDNNYIFHELIILVKFPYLVRKPHHNHTTLLLFACWQMSALSRNIFTFGLIFFSRFSGL